MFEAVLILLMVFTTRQDLFFSVGSEKLSEPTETEHLDGDEPPGEIILKAARFQVEKRIRYRMAYPPIPYPGGDIPAAEGLCCDVVVRAFRAAGMDLQQLVYEDSHKARKHYLEVNRFTRFPRPLNRSWIHRRTSNLNLFFSRHAESLPTRFRFEEKDLWQPGDIVIYRRYGWETWHIAVVSDVTDPHTAVPMIIDAWSSPGYCAEVHRLTDHGPIGGHYRITEDLLAELTDEDHRERAYQAWLTFASDLETSQWTEKIAEETSFPPSAGPAIPGSPRSSFRFPGLEVFNFTTGG